MSNRPSSPGDPGAKKELAGARIQRLARFGLFYARVALGAAFLSAVGGSFWALGQIRHLGKLR